MKVWKTFATALVFLFGCSAAAVEAAQTSISLVLVCDVYKMSEENGRGGMARIAGALKAEKARSPHVLIAHAGDAFSPSLMSGFDQGAHMVDLLNLMPIDAFVPGNHEFDFGKEAFLKRIGEAKFPLLAANLRDAQDRPLPGFEDSRMFDFGGVKVGVVGLAPQDTSVKSKPGDLRFSSMRETAERQAAALRRAGADLIVLVSHSNRTLDTELMNAGLADVILSGDDHDIYLNYNGRSAIVEAGQDGYIVAAIDLTVDVTETGGKRGVAWWPRFRFVDTADVAADPEVAARVAAYEASLSKELDVALGTTSTELDSRHIVVRGGEAAIGNLIADAMRQAVDAEIAITNGGGIRGNVIYAPGSKMTRRSVLTELPFGNKTVLLEIKGANLEEALEQGFARVEKLVGAFPQVSGLVIGADVTRPAGDRVVKLSVNGQPLDPARTYRLATNEFLAGGGDGYLALKSAKVVVGPNDGSLLANDVASFISTQGSVAAAIEGRIVVARESPPQ
ncbi:MAG: bifunctional metallophosphatase/5'-nucleotidase [Pseudomonadota bacterium]|nr:bifunctional metallophosphatase/5'-nucleotidase [Pseudomonadota bacterium]